MQSGFGHGVLLGQLSRAHSTIDQHSYYLQMSTDDQRCQVGCAKQRICTHKLSHKLPHNLFIHYHSLTLKVENKNKNIRRLYADVYLYFYPSTQPHSILIGSSLAHTTKKKKDITEKQSDTERLLIHARG